MLPACAGQQFGKRRVGSVVGSESGLVIQPAQGPESTVIEAVAGEVGNGLVPEKVRCRIRDPITKPGGRL
jgi:hypothetical protein